MTAKGIESGPSEFDTWGTASYWIKMLKSTLFQCKSQHRGAILSSPSPSRDASFSGHLQLFLGQLTEEAEVGQPKPTQGIGLPPLECISSWNNKVTLIKTVE